MTIPQIPIKSYNGEDPAVFMRDYLRRYDHDDKAAKETAEGIVDEVRRLGDRALLEYTKRFDGATLTSETLRVSNEEIQAAYAAVSGEMLVIIKHAILRIRRYHERQPRTGWMEPFAEGEFMGQLINPIASCGLYVPGGTASLASSLLMLAVPALVAGVPRLIVCTPCDKFGQISPNTLVVAAETGIREIYKIGGAQAIAAMAFGTETVPRVDKICGPGNTYVMMAKRIVYGQVGVDSLPGPSEIAIIADDSADPRHVAADLLSQAEHGERAALALFTDSRALAEVVQAEVIAQGSTLERRAIIAESVANNGLIVVVKDLFDALRLTDTLAPEHLALETKDPLSLLSRVKNAGAVFLGHYTPEPLGDYLAGPSHVLPTDTTARFFSPVSVDDFLKKTSVIYFDKPALGRVKNDAIRFANAEGLTAHANAVRVRG